MGLYKRTGSKLAIKSEHTYRVRSTLQEAAQHGAAPPEINDSGKRVRRAAK